MALGAVGGATKLKPWMFIVSGGIIAAINPVLGALVMWPGFTMWLHRRLDRRQ